MIALSAFALITPTDSVDNAVLLIDEESGKVHDFGTRGSVEVPAGTKFIDYPEAILAPGFLDLHVHGGAGHDVMENDSASLDAIESFLAKHGVTNYCPTTVTSPTDQTLRSLANLGHRIRKNGFALHSRGARPLGIHLEGPFISKLKCGVHPVDDIVPPSVELFEKFWQASEGTISVMTIAPELPNADETIRAAVQRGVKVSLGHSNSGSHDAESAVAAGATHATHTFNAMRSLNHRDPGILGVVLSDDRLSADIVADGVHVAPEIIKLFLAAKGDRAVLITDGISATGMPDGRYRLGTFQVELKGNRCSMNGHIAGSVLTMDLAVRNVMTYAQWTLQKAVALATLNPARTLAMDNSKGSLAPGKDADVVVLSKTGKVLDTFIRGARL